MIPTLTARAAAEPLHTFGARVLVHVMHHGTATIEDNEILELAAHVSMNLHTEHSTDQITAAVVEIRRTVAQRRANVTRTLAALGFTNGPNTPVILATGGNPFTVEEITFLKNFFREVKGQAGEPEGGARVPRNPRKPNYPPAGAQAVR